MRSANPVFSSLCLLALALTVRCQPPRVVSCNDEDFEGSTFASNSEIEALGDETGVTRYSVHYTVTPSGPPLQPEIISFSPGSGSQLTRELSGQLPQQISPGSDFYLVVLAHTGTGQTRGSALLCHDKAVPTQRAQGLAFEDADWRSGQLAGTITIQRAANEADLESYAVHTAVNETNPSGTRSWRFLSLLGEVVKDAVVVTTEATSVCRCEVVAEDQFCRGPSSLIGGTTSIANCSQRCDDLPQCRFFAAGRVGSPREGRCYIFGGDCQELDASTNYDVFNFSSGSVNISGLGTPQPEACHCGMIPGTLHRTVVAEVPTITVPTGTPAGGASHLIVVTQNADGDMTLSSQLEKWVSIPLQDLDLQLEPPADLTFEDLDTEQGIQRGQVRFTALLDGDGVEFRVYLAEGAANIQPLSGSNPQSIRTFNGSNLLTVFLGAACPDDDTPTNKQDACALGEEELDQPIGMDNNTLPLNRTCGSCTLAARATHILVVPAGGGEEVRDLSRSVKIVDRTGRPPNIQVRSISFTDVDVNPNLIGGTVQIRVAQPEPKDIRAYRLYFQGEGDQSISQVLRGGRAEWLGEVMATGSDVEITFAHSTIIPAGAVRLAVTAVNADGEGPLGRGVSIRDIGSGTEAFRSPVAEVAIILGSLFLIFACACGCLMLRTRFKAFLHKMWDSEVVRNSETGEMQSTSGRNLGRASEVGMSA